MSSGTVITGGVVSAKALGTISPGINKIPIRDNPTKMEKLNF
jgi:hypothetical protein